jgi:modification target Cys-rich repeat protein
MKKKKGEILSRREFFKNAAKGTIPIIGMLLMSSVGSNLLSSCTKGDEDDSCSECSGKCESGCLHACSSGCKNICGGSCSARTHYY